MERGRREGKEESREIGKERGKKANARQAKTKIQEQKLLNFSKKVEKKCVAKLGGKGGGKMESGRAMESGRVRCQLTVAPCAVVASS